MNRKICIVVACAMVAAGAIGAQDTSGTPPQLTLQDVLDSASAAGDDFLVNASGLYVARKQRALDLARQGLSLGASGSYAMAAGIGDDSTTANQALIGRAVVASGGSAPTNYLGLSQAPQGSLSLIGPLTKATLGVSHSFPVPQPTNTTAAATPQFSSLGLGLSQTVWDGYPGGQYRAVLAKSLLAFQGKELTAVQGGISAVSKVKQAYIALLAAQRDLDIKRQVLAKQQSLLNQIQAIFEIKQATAIDLKTAQVNVRSAQIDSRTADKTLRLANERLAVIMGKSPGERFSVADIEDPAMPAASVDEAIAIGLQKRSDVAQLDMNAKSSLIDAALARAQAKPNISVTGGAGLAIGWTATPVLATALSLGAKIALPVFDSGVADLQARTSEGQAAQYGFQAAQLRKTLASDIRDYFEGARLQAERVGLAKDSMDLADAQFELVKAQNKYGTATVQDVLTASVTAATAEVGYGTAKSAYLSVVLQLSTAMGL